MGQVHCVICDICELRMHGQTRVGVTKFSQFCSRIIKAVVIKYHGQSRQVSAQLGCGNNNQIQMWSEEFNMVFWSIHNGEINERSFSKPQPWGG